MGPPWTSADRGRYGRGIRLRTNNPKFGKLVNCAFGVALGLGRGVFGREVTGAVAA